MRSASEPELTEQADRTSPHPAMGAMDLLGQRWTLRVIWELEPGPLGFLELRRRMGNCSSSMLSERLQRLQRHGILEKRADKTYELAFAGTELSNALQQLWDWSERWASNLTPETTAE
ncbi:winged helix-turn-helix transcriptional regulator [Rhodococcus erythropolis]|uniref:winged helix-turn-helix transcriptional regulator n=1 Tax=Rhodococcus erythropolis TaxID=1833 RepID=UPI003D1461B2